MKEELEKQVAEAAKELFGIDVKAELTRPEEKFGDYSTNVALQISKQAGQNPREIGESLAEELKTRLDGKASEVSVAVPGFINIKLSDQALTGAMNEEPAKTLAGKKVVAEYSDPNPFKVLHAGHLYTSLVGDAIARLMEAAGAEVHRVNFGGDVGLHVGKTMWAIINNIGAEEVDRLSEVAEDQRLDWISERYVEGNRAYEEDDSAKQAIIEINKRVYKIHEENDKSSQFAKIYWKCRKWSYDGFNELYQRLEIVPFEKYYPESETAPIGLKTVREHVGEVYQESQGAIVFDGEKHDLHTRVFINSEGLPTYEAKDVGLIMKKWEDYKFDLSLVITGNDIIEYMKVVLKSIEQFEPELVERSTHLTHGIVKLAGGEKMSSRLGNILRASDVLEAAHAAMEETGHGNEDETYLGAIKYAFIKNRIGGDIVYDPQESVSLEGNSGPYLQYAHARAQSILKKGGEGKLADNLEAGERSLVRKLSEYSEVMDKAVSELMPHHVATYLYELAQDFNHFYEHNRVIDDPRQDTRLYLVQRYAATLKNGLNLLGIAAPDRM